MGIVSTDEDILSVRLNRDLVPDGIGLDNLRFVEPIEAIPERLEPQTSQS